MTEHAKILHNLRTQFVLVRSREDFQDLTHLILPGGESTTMEKLLKKFEMWDEILRQIQNDNLKVFGTCAGAILLAKFGAGWSVQRNGFGAQQASFSTVLKSKTFPDLRGVFIRAPRLKPPSKPPSNSPLEKGGETEVLATFENEPVLVRDGNFLGASFHPEIAGETRVHEFFLQKF
ncbi:MAG: pyridoxal 5'-phosphate synthase glutaminase subunit PdxT [Candidatus Gracilibacteria bacterium]|nr:pyridoxal 5'-phosphate synthase glutaminase subunit PdxT [Candidatus Gracilibacteria bacterium]